MKYLVMAFRTPNFQLDVIDKHRHFLNDLREQGILEDSGPFTDKSGGAYVIKAQNLEEAVKITNEDPIFKTKSSSIKLYEWNVG